MLFRLRRRFVRDSRGGGIVQAIQIGVVREYLTSTVPEAEDPEKDALFFIQIFLLNSGVFLHPFCHQR